MEQRQVILEQHIQTIQNSIQADRDGVGRNKQHIESIQGTNLWLEARIEASLQIVATLRALAK